MAQESTRPSAAPETGRDGTPAADGAVPEDAEPGAALMAAPEPSSGALSAPEIREFAAELASQLFQRWEVALQEQFRAELAVRLESELEHRRVSARNLQEEVQERRLWIENPWSQRNRHGPYGYESWQMERTLRTQSSELAEMEREMHALRERLRDLGGEEGETIVTVEPTGEQPDAGPAPLPDAAPDAPPSAEG